MADNQAQKAVFTSGNTMKHVVVMTATSSIGLVSIFFVDVLNLFYISLLGQQELAAAIGYAATIMFFSVSICIGMSIAASAIVAKAIGMGDDEKARQLATVSLILVTATSAGFALLLYPTVSIWLELIGAKGETLTLAHQFMKIVVPSIPLLGLGMCLGALLRSKGDPRRAMFVTLSGGLAALILDPIFIFVLDLGLSGAALATVLVRVVLVIVGLWGVVSVHRMCGPVKINHLTGNFVYFFSIALPAVATQLATPVGNAYVTQAMARFGDDAVAGWAIIGRLIPVAFGVTFALSGSVGPILGQNFGAKLFPRINQALRDAFLFSFVYCIVVWALLALGSSWVVWLFDAQGLAASLITIFCWIVAGSFLFNSALFVANAAFNNLGFALYATAFNWGRATLGVIPFVYVGQFYGPEGVLVAWGLGAVIFGIAAAATATYVVRGLSEDSATSLSDAPMDIPPTANSPFTSGKGASFGVGNRYSNDGRSDS